MEERSRSEPIVEMEQRGDVLELRFAGDWSQPHPAEMPDAQALSRVQRVVARGTESLTGWGSSLLVALLQLKTACDVNEVTLDLAEMPEGVRRLIALSTAVPERQGARRSEKRESLVSRVGQQTITAFKETGEAVRFLGECTIALSRMLVGKARVRRRDLLEMIQAAGPEGLPIITLISLLVGTIVAFMGAAQFKMLGLELYIADMVGIGMVREMGALMTGIIVAGRTGAAYAAQLGTMQVNEEIDALKTSGFSPIEFLVLPRMIALILMTPLLTIYANILGILGGGLIGVTMLDLGVVQYWHQTIGRIGLDDAFSGVIKSVVFGVLVAIAGCMRGIRCGRNASAVGDAATQAVVSGIVYIIVADAILSIIFMVTGF